MFSRQVQKRAPRKRGRSIFKIGLILLTLVTVIAFCFIFLLVLLTYTIPQIHLNTIIHIPPTAHYYTETYYGGTSVGLIHIYYTSTANIDDLQQWYRDYYLPFERFSQERMITAKAFDEAALQDGIDSMPCRSNPFSVYQCVSVEIIDLSSDAVEDIRSINTTLYLLPNTGTLLIYQYYIMDA